MVFDSTIIHTGHIINVRTTSTPVGFITTVFLADVVDHTGQVVATVGPFATDRAAFNAAVQLSCAERGWVG